MEWDFIWKAILIVLGGTTLLRIAGRKTISQMTLAETVIMIAIGSLLIQPVSGKNIGTTFAVGAVLVGTLIVMEYIQIKSDGFETLITGKSKTLIENGQLNEKNLAKVRMSVDQLEMNLRQNNVTKISDVQYATLEPNGKLGYTLKQDAQPVTKKEFNQLMQQLGTNYSQLEQMSQQLTQLKKQSNQQENIFEEVKNKGHHTPTPNHLQ